MSATLALEIRATQVFGLRASVTMSISLNFILCLQLLLMKLQVGQVILILCYA